MKVGIRDFCDYNGKPDFWPEWWTRLRVNLGAFVFGRTNLIVFVEGHALLCHGPSTLPDVSPADGEEVNDVR